MNGRVTRVQRSVDPVQDVEQHIERRRGVLGQHEIARRIESVRRQVPADPIRLARTYPWYRANIGASGDTAYLMRVAVPSSDSAWAMTNLAIRMPNAGRIVGGDIWSSEARTGGTATLRVRVTQGGTATDYDFPDCVLNATYTQTNSVALWNGAPAFAAGATIEARIVTASTWAPTTADVGALVAVVFDLT